jgi:hypothetical protein
MISSEIGRCLNALGIVKKERRHCTIVMKMNKLTNRLTDCFHNLSLFFLYEPLCMSSHDSVADHLWSYGVKKTPRSFSDLKTGLL